VIAPSALLPCALCLLPFLLGCREAGHAPPNTIVIALANSPTNMDPGVGLDEASQKIHQLLYSSLVKIDPSLRVVPDLATRFETTDYQTYVASIPAGVTFHNGEEMTADDIAYTFRRFLNPSFVSGRKGAYRALSSIDVVDRYTVAFHLQAPSASFPINLVMGIVPAGSGADLARHPVGSGPFTLEAFVPDDHVTLRPFAGYYAGAPKNGGLTFRVVPDETMRGLELRKGSVDVIVNDLSPDLVHGLQEDGRLNVITAPGTDYAYIGFNLRDRLLQDRRVRQAIGYAVDQNAIVKYLRRDLAQPATGIVPPMSWAYAPDVLRFTHDPAKARALLDEAGYPDPDGDGPAPRLHLSLKTSTDERYRLQAAVIQQSLAEVGVGVDIRSAEFATLMSDVLRGNVQLYTLQWVGVTDPDMLRRAFHSSQIPPSGFNRGFYKNPEVDRLIDAAGATLDEAERGRLYRDAQRIIAADAPYISLWYKTNFAVAQPDLAGIRLTPTAEFTFFKDVSRKLRIKN
jgi:peptide/nickel transport system substrate-binding protein